MPTLCAITDCGRPVRNRGWCDKHFRRWLRHGDPEKLLTPWDRFWAKVDTTGICWEWTGSLTGPGHGHLWFQGRYRGAHCVAYELLVGPIPAGLHLDHLCRNRPCVNPDHLEPVTPAENIRRGSSLSAQRARRTECPKGHPYDAENTVTDRRGRRYCRECRRAADRVRGSGETRRQRQAAS